jgi:hypothetical protein
MASARAAIAYDSGGIDCTIAAAGTAFVASDSFVSNVQDSIGDFITSVKTATDAHAANGRCGTSRLDQSTSSGLDRGMYPARRDQHQPGVLDVEIHHGFRHTKDHSDLRRCLALRRPGQRLSLAVVQIDGAEPKRCAGHTCQPGLDDRR